MRQFVPQPPVKIGAEGKPERYKSFYEAFCAQYQMQNPSQKVPIACSQEYRDWKQAEIESQSRLESMTRSRRPKIDPARIFGGTALFF